MSLLNYIRVWLACARYSIVRTMMFRFDFIMWSMVEFFWMSVNVLLVSVIYRHTREIAGWTQYEMLLLVGTSMVMQRFLMGFFWSNLFELGRNIRTGHFDFFLIVCGLFVQYGALLLIVSLTFWIIGSTGVEGSYFTLFEFSRLPRQAFRGVANLLFVWTLPVVLVTNVPASTLLHGVDLTYVPWLILLTVLWVSVGVFVFHRGLRRYSSASS
jgi:ABC-2 type transport system permease protein